MSLTKFALVAVSVVTGFAGLTATPSGALAGESCWFCSEEAPLPPPVQRTIRNREVVEPGEYSVVRKPSLYGRKIYVRERNRWVPYEGSDDRVLLRPYKNIVLRTPPRLRHTRERVIIQPEGE
jgi:hypothetical protein